MRVGSEAVALFESLLVLSGRQREEELETRTAGNPALREQVMRLLARDEEVHGIDLEQPAFGAHFHLLRTLDAASRPIRTFPLQVGRYLVQSEIGVGAMGVVYRAEQDQPRRPVALKLLLRGKDEALDQQVFRAEMQALARVQHPGIVQIHDAGVLELEGNRFPFLVMELVEGENLLAWDRRASPDLQTRIRLLGDLCSAVEAAHQRGVLHRDLKPDNIVVDTSGPFPRPRVLDFGIARLAHATAGVAPDQTTLIVGTPAYMSPEQAAGRPDVDTRSDVYSLGAVAHRLLGGTDVVPDASGSLEATLRAVRESAPVPLSDLDRSLGGDLEAVVSKALAKDPEQRHASARDLGLDFERVLARQPVSARSQGSWYRFTCLVRREPWKVASGSILLLLLSAALFQQVHAANQAERDLTRFVRQSRQHVVRMLEPLGRLAVAAEARREVLEQMLTELDAAHLVRPEDVELLATVYDVLRLLGDIQMDSGEHEAALRLRLRALGAIDERIRLSPPDDALTSERATALVRVGDAVSTLNGFPAALKHYRVAHATFVRLVDSAPHDVRRIDDLFWSCQRLAQGSVTWGLLDEALEVLSLEERCLRELEQLRPDHPANHAGWFALHCLRANFADKQDDPEAAIQHLAEAVRRGRARFQHEPGSRPAIVDLAAALLSHVYRSGPGLDEETAQSQVAEAVRVLEGLLVQEASHRVARKLLLWARFVPRIREAATWRDPVTTPLRQAALHLEHARSAWDLLERHELEMALDWTRKLLDDVPMAARGSTDHAHVLTELEAAVAKLGPSPR